MKWTTETPKVEGWYWQRICLHPARVVKLWQSQQDGRWWFDEAGPIPEPEE